MRALEQVSMFLISESIELTPRAASALNHPTRPHGHVCWRLTRFGH